MPQGWENLSALGVLGGAFLLGLKWLLAHTSKLLEQTQALQKQSNQIMQTTVAENTKIMGQVSGALRENTDRLRELTVAIQQCPNREGKKTE